MGPILTSAAVLIVLLLVGLLLSDCFAHRDEITARRFQELSPEVVNSPADQDRNARWHRTGLLLRVTVAVLLAIAVGFGCRSWQAGVTGAGILGFSVALWFDICFNVRFGMPWYYTGTTAETDKAASGMRMAMLESIGIGASALLWLLFVRL